MFNRRDIFTNPFKKRGYPKLDDLTAPGADEKIDQELFGSSTESGSFKKTLGELGEKTPTQLGKELNKRLGTNDIDKVIEYSTKDGEKATKDRNETRSGNERQQKKDLIKRKERLTKLVEEIKSLDVHPWTPLNKIPEQIKDKNKPTLKLFLERIKETSRDDLWMESIKNFREDIEDSIKDIDKELRNNTK